MKSLRSGVKHGECLFPVLLVFLCWFANEQQAQERERAVADAGRPAVVTIAFVGDLIFHRDLQRIAMADGARYRNFWSAADQIFQSADAVYGNLEGTLASTLTPSGERVADPGRHFNSPVYSAPDALKNFNYHFSLARDLRESGFRIVSTGNNHALDRGSAGVDQTIERLTAEGIVAIGTRHSAAQDDGWRKTVRVGTFNIGWVACTYGTNGHDDVLNQVLDCYDEKAETLKAIEALAARPDVDAVFFTPHWGIENHTVIEIQQAKLAQEAAHAGATAIVGTHPHVLQTWQWFSNASGGDVPVIYSTGNFISAQPRAEQRHGIIVVATLKKPASSGKAQLADLRYLTTAFAWPPGAVTLTDCDRTYHALLPPDLALGAGETKKHRAPCD